MVSDLEGLWTIENETHIKSMVKLANVLVTASHGPFEDEKPGFTTKVKRVAPDGESVSYRVKLIATHPEKDMQVWMAPADGTSSFKAVVPTEELKLAAPTARIIGISADGKPNTSSGKWELRSDGFGYYHGTTYDGWSGSGVRVNNKQVIGIHKFGNDEKDQPNGFTPFSQEDIDWIHACSGNGPRLAAPSDV